MAAKTLPAEGTMTADFENQPEFVANSGFLITKTETRWILGATHRTAEGFRHVNFYLPPTPGDGVPITFDLGPTTGGFDVRAAYSNDVYLAWSKEGTLTIEYSALEQRMRGTFAFKGDVGGLTFNLSNGVFDIREVADKKTGQERNFTADLSGGVASAFSADFIEITRNANTQELAVVADQLVWEPLPPKYHRVTLFIAQDVKKGTHVFKAEDEKIRAAYVAWENGIYPAFDGELKLEEDPSVEHFVATLKFSAKDLSTEQSVELFNGVIRYRS
jgi:hypothetical protein